MNVEQRWRWHWNINIGLYFYQQRTWCEQDVLLAQRNRKSWKSSSTRINHFKSCKTSLFLPFPLLLRLICEPERQSFGELQKSHPNTSLAYFWQILSKLFPLFSLPTDHSKRSFWEEREKGASFVIMYSFCNMCHHRYHEILIIIKIFSKFGKGGAHAASMSSRSCGWTSKQNHNHNFGKGQDVKHFSRYKGGLTHLY